VNLNYVAPPTIARFAACEAPVQCLLGPIGGGKTTGVLMKILSLACAQKATKGGLRKTRWAVVRNTRPQLRDSVLKTVFDWLPPDGKHVIWRETDMTLLVQFKLPDDTYVKCEMLFRALDDAQDAQRLLSVEYTGGWLSEFREIPLPLLTDLRSRCGRYPRVEDDGCGGATWHGVLAESNMPTKGSSWHELLEEKRPPWLRVFIQPSGLSELAENTKYLPKTYYTDLLSGATENWIKAHIKCEYPDSLDGKAVYSQTFQSDVHVAKAPIVWIRGSAAPPILIGMDQGRSPACLISQVEARGRLNVLRELYASGIAMDGFVTKYLMPLLANEFADSQFLVVIDPAGCRKGEARDESPKDILTGHGFKVIPAPSNALDRRIPAVERLLLLRDGLLIDPSCKMTIAALSGEYRYKTKKNGDLEDTPEKKHPWSDLMDDLQYISQIAGGSNWGHTLRRLNRRGGPADVPPPTRAWS
jgi:hypothetical protein